MIKMCCYSKLEHFISIFLICLLNVRYEQAEFIEREMQKMAEQVKSVIQTVNSSQVKSCKSFASDSYPSSWQY